MALCRLCAGSVIGYHYALKALCTMVDGLTLYGSEVRFGLWLRGPQWRCAAGVRIAPRMADIFIMCFRFGFVLRGSGVSAGYGSEVRFGFVLWGPGGSGSGP